MENVTRLRILYLLRILEERTDAKHTLSISQIIKILQSEYHIITDRNALTKDLNTLRETGYPIWKVRSVQNLYYYDKHTFKISELSILIDAVASSRFITEEETELLIEKIESLAGSEDAKKLSSHVNVIGRVKNGNGEGFVNVDIINQAISMEKRISFQYFDYNSAREKILRHDGQFYEVSPFTLVWDGNDYYVVGYNHVAGKVENFRLDRIWNTCSIAQKEAISKPEGFVLEDYLKQTFSMFATDETMYVELQGKSDTMKFLIDQFGKNVDSVPISEEEYRARVNIFPSPTFFRWVFGFGGDIRIIGPQKVLDAYHDLAKKALEM